MAATDPVDAASWLEHWTLKADGKPAMLKIAHEPEDRRGSQLASAALGC